MTKTEIRIERERTANRDRAAAATSARARRSEKRAIRARGAAARGRVPAVYDRERYGHAVDIKPLPQRRRGRRPTSNGIYPPGCRALFRRRGVRPRLDGTVVAPDGIAERAFAPAPGRPVNPGGV